MKCQPENIMKSADVVTGLYVPSPITVPMYLNSIKSSEPLQLWKRQQKFYFYRSYLKVQVMG